MAPDITVGDAHPGCDTYTTRPAGPSKDHPVVGDCYVASCVFNGSESWRANGITVGGHDRGAESSRSARDERVMGEGESDRTVRLKRETTTHRFGGRGHLSL